jgi:hypothetical protein
MLLVSSLGLAFFFSLAAGSALERVVLLNFNGKICSSHFVCAIHFVPHLRCSWFPVLVWRFSFPLLLDLLQSVVARSCSESERVAVFLS